MYIRASVWNNKTGWDKDKCRCECKELIQCKDNCDNFDKGFM